MTSYDKQVGEIIRIEWDQETGTVRIVMDILDEDFKRRVLHNKEYADLLSIKGKAVMMVATRKKNENT
jgi:hypothetical protein